MPLQIGSLLNDRYRITGVLGQSSLGAVYLATDESLRVACAVKENLAVSAESERVFWRDASQLAGLRHHCLPRVTNHFVLDNQQYLVMDYIEGEDLRQRLAREGPLPERLVVGWAVQLADALTYMHTRNPPVLHGDIKPANIKLTPAGEIALVGFGMAKPPGGNKETAATAFTPPELYGPGRIDQRADEYAFGATLYTLLTGQSPPTSADRLSHARLIPAQTVSPSLTSALTRALAIKPEGRFRDVAAFKAALLGGPRTGPVPSLRPSSAAEANGPARAAPPRRAEPPPTLPPAPQAASPAPPPARRLAWPWLVGLGCLALLVAALALAGGGALGYLLVRPTTAPTAAPTRTLAVSETPGVSTATATLPATSAATATGQPPAPSLTLAASATVALATDLPATATAPAVTPTASATTAPAGTPIGSGGRIAFLSNRDGALFQIYTMNPDGSDVQQLTTDAATKWDPNWPFNGTQLAWSPDGQQLIYVAENADGRGTDLFMINADGSHLVNLTNHAGDDFQPDWCSDGSIWFASTRVSNGVQQIFHTDLASISKGFSPINFSATHNFPREYDPTLYSGCTRALYVSTLDGPPELWRYWPDCPACFSKVRSAKDQGGKTEEPALSPDNQYLAYTLELGNSKEIVIGKLADRLVNAQVTTTQANFEAQWSPDGQWLVFVSARDGNREIYTMTLAGANQTNLSQNPATDTDPVWQPAP